MADFRLCKYFILCVVCHRIHINEKTIFFRSLFVAFVFKIQICKRKQAYPEIQQQQ